MQHVVIYLDTDMGGDDLRDSAGNPVQSGWYRYEWPLQPEPVGPFNDRLSAINDEYPQS